MKNYLSTIFLFLSLSIGIAQVQNVHITPSGGTGGTFTSDSLSLTWPSGGSANFSSGAALNINTGATIGGTFWGMGVLLGLSSPTGGDSGFLQLNSIGNIPTSNIDPLSTFTALGNGTPNAPTVTLTGNTHSNATIDGLSSTAGIYVGSQVYGNGIYRTVVGNPVVVTAVSANSVTVSPSTTATLTGVTLTFYPGINTTGNTHLGTNVIDGIPSTAGMVINSGITGTNIPTSPGQTLITAITSSTSITISANCTASASGVGISVFPGTTEISPELDFRRAQPLTSSWALDRFWHVAKKIQAGGNYTEKNFFIGDSMIVTSLAELKDGLSQVWGGYSGYGIGTTQSAIGGGTTNVTNAFNYWVNGVYWDVPPSGWVSFHNNGAAILSNTFEIAYIKESAGANTFKLQYSTNLGSTWTDMTGYTSLSANNATTIGAFVTGAMPSRDYYMIRAYNTDATNHVKIIGATLYDSLSPGVVNYMNAYGGTQLTNYTTTPSAITLPILEGIAPDLIIYSNTDSIYYEQTLLPVLYSNLNGTSSDFWGIGVNPGNAAPGLDANGNYTNDAARLIDNALEDFCKSVGGAYWDQHGHLAPFLAEHAIGFDADGVHLNTAGGTFSVAKMINKLGLDRFLLAGAQNRTILNSIDPIGLGNYWGQNYINPATTDIDTQLTIGQRPTANTTWMVYDKKTFSPLLQFGYLSSGAANSYAGGFQVQIGSNPRLDINPNGPVAVGVIPTTTLGYLHVGGNSDLPTIYGNMTYTGQSAVLASLNLTTGSTTVNDFYVDQSGNVWAAGNYLGNLAPDPGGVFTSLSGTVAGSSGTTLTGTSTSFTTNFHVGQNIGINGEGTFTVTSISSNTSLTTAEKLPTFTGATYGSYPMPYTGNAGSIVTQNQVGLSITSTGTSNTGMLTFYNTTSSKAWQMSVTGNSGGAFWLSNDLGYIPFYADYNALSGAVHITSSGVDLSAGTTKLNFASAMVKTSSGSIAQAATENVDYAGAWTMTSNTTGTVTFNTGTHNETVYNTSASTISALTMTLPSTAAQGQTLRYQTHGIVTALTMAGQTVDGWAAPTAMTADSVIAFQCESANGHFVRIQ